MNKIEWLPLDPQPRGQRAGLFKDSLIPAHVGDAQLTLRRETSNDPRKNTQPRTVTLLRTLKQSLQPKTNPQKGTVSRNPLPQKTIEVGIL